MQKKTLQNKTFRKKNKQNITPCKKNKTSENKTKPLAKKHKTHCKNKHLRKNIAKQKQQTKYTLQHRNTKPIAKKKKSPWQKKTLEKTQNPLEKSNTL